MATIVKHVCKTCGKQVRYRTRSGETGYFHVEGKGACALLPEVKAVVMRENV